MMKSPRFYVYCMLYASLYKGSSVLIVRVLGWDTDSTVIKRHLSSHPDKGLAVVQLQG